MTQTILLLLGPDQSGTRAAAEDIAAHLRTGLAGTTVAVAQFGQEAALVAAVDAAGPDVTGIVLDPGDLAAVAHDLARAVSRSALPVFEVHAGPAHRADGHLHSLSANAVTGTITGFGLDGYLEAARRIAELSR